MWLLCRSGDYCRRSSPRTKGTGLSGLRHVDPVRVNEPDASVSRAPFSPIVKGQGDFLKEASRREVPGGSDRRIPADGQLVAGYGDVDHRKTAPVDVSIGREHAFCRVTTVSSCRT